MCVAQHIASLTMPVNVFRSRLAYARIATGPRTTVASIGIAFTDAVMRAGAIAPISVTLKSVRRT